MASPREKRVARKVVQMMVDDIEIKDTIARIVEPKKLSMLEQYHTVHVGDHIQLNGTIFNVMSGVYAWHMVGPDGKDCPLTCDTMPSPYFTPYAVGVYNVTLPTDDGMAEITFNVCEAL